MNKLKLLFSTVLLLLNSQAEEKNNIPNYDQPSVVSITGNHISGFKLILNNQPHHIKGVGGQENLTKLASLGGNTIRTWGVDDNTFDILNNAHKNGISVTLGIWLEHERHGFDYKNKDFINDQRTRVKETVQKYKNHPALLSWGLGNEMEGFEGNGDDKYIWEEVNYLSSIIKEIDSNHPVMTVIAGVNEHKIEAIKKYAPNIDILGINSYGGAPQVSEYLQSYKWKKPFVITEFGLPGPWEVPHTSWNAPIEPTSREKMAHYYSSYQAINETDQCLGSYAFLWGNKQEATSSWFGMLLDTGEKLPTSDAISRAWNDKWPNNRAPILKEVDVPFISKTVKKDKEFRVQVLYEDPDNDNLDYVWQIFKETNDRKIGGDKENTPDEISGILISSRSKGRAVIKTPNEKGAYRLFVTVRDGEGSAAVDNWPFYVD